MIDEEKLLDLVKRAVREVLNERGYAVRDELLEKDDVAKLFGVTTRTITTWMTREAMPHEKSHGGRVLFQREAVLRWARERGIFARPLKAVS